MPSPLLGFVPEPLPRAPPSDERLVASSSLLVNGSFTSIALNDLHQGAAASFNGAMSTGSTGSFTFESDPASQSAAAVTSLTSTSRRRRDVGRGVAARVLAHFDDHGRPMCAEKQISTMSKDKAATARRELRFADRAASARVPLLGIVNIHGAYHNAAEYMTCVVMEYMDAGSATRLSPTPENVLAEIARQLIDGLRSLHETLNVVHRDLKPENVLLNSSGSVKIADFGVAALLSDIDTAANDQVGTILQMAPERLRGEAHGPASDIWSLGVTVAQLVLGKHPFVAAAGQYSGNERFWLLAEAIKHTGTEEECESATRAAIDMALASTSPELRDFVHRCTAVAPHRRASLSELEHHRFLKSADRKALALLAMKAAVSQNKSPSTPCEVSPQSIPPTSPFAMPFSFSLTHQGAMKNASTSGEH